jgi:MFS family permease
LDHNIWNNGILTSHSWEPLVATKASPKGGLFMTTATASTWSALRNPTFRKLWIASLVSGTCVAAHDTAATWVMSTLTASPFLISLMSTVASLPFLIFTLPAGALADMVDRRKLLMLMNLWLTIAASALAVLGWIHLLSTSVILISVFLMGIGFAFAAPAWSSIVPEIVSPQELRSASTLGGLQLNISGILGPALGGVWLAWRGPTSVFAVNAACFLAVIVVVLQWKPRLPQSSRGLENFFDSFLKAIRYVRYAPGLQIVLARNALFALFISAVPALIPVIGLKSLHLSASQLGLLFTSQGIGSVAGAVVIIPWLRARYSSNHLIVLANALVAIVYVLMAFVRQPWLFFLVAAMAGVGWTLSASELWVAAQRAMPSWVRGRMSATIMMVSQGAMAIGGIIWGSAVTTAGPAYSLLAAAALLLVSLVLAGPLSIDFTDRLDLDPAPVTTASYRLLYTPKPTDGPVSICVEFNVDRVRAPEFVHIMREVRLIHLRNGAYRWQLHKDLTCTSTYRLEMTVASWNEHLMQFERMTKFDKDLLERAWNFHTGETLPAERIYLSLNKELYLPR